MLLSLLRNTSLPILVRFSCVLFCTPGKRQGVPATSLTFFVMTAWVDFVWTELVVDTSVRTFDLYTPPSAIVGIDRGSFVFSVVRWVGVRFRFVGSM